MSADLYLRTAERLRRTRRLRDEVFHDHVEGFGEPAFDMLLELFIAGGGDTRAIARDQVLAEAGCERPAAALYCKWLRSRGLIVEAGDNVALSERGHELLVAFLDAEALDRARDDAGMRHGREGKN